MTEGCDEQAVALPKLLADPGARGVEERSGGFLGILWTIEGMLSQDRRGSERLVSRSGPLGGRLHFDLLNQGESASSPNLFRKVLPAGERREMQGFKGRELETVESFSPVATAKAARSAPRR